MNQSKISVRYAKALYLLSVEKGNVDKVREDILAFTNLSDNEQFLLLLESPVIKTKQKQEIISNVFKGRISTISLNFLNLLIENKRESYLFDICRNFIDILRRDNNIMAGSFITATHMSSEIEDKVKKIAEEFFKTNIELDTVIDSSMIGGYILRVGDNQLDASVSSNLNKIKRELINTEFDNNIENK